MRSRFAYSSTAAASQLFGDGARPAMYIYFVEGRRRREQRGEHRVAACGFFLVSFAARRWRAKVLMTIRATNAPRCRCKAALQGLLPCHKNGCKSTSSGCPALGVQTSCDCADCRMARRHPGAE